VRGAWAGGLFESGGGEGLKSGCYEEKHRSEDRPLQEERCQPEGRHYEDAEHIEEKQIPRYARDDNAGRPSFSATGEKNDVGLKAAATQARNY
jgi:hypothetical protein